MKTPTALPRSAAFLYDSFRLLYRLSRSSDTSFEKSLVGTDAVTEEKDELTRFFH